MYLQKPQPGPDGVTVPEPGHEDSGEAGLSRRITAGGRIITYSEFGAPGGYPLLYCHQYGGSRLEAAALAESARCRGFRIVAADRPGLGGSDYASTETVDPADDLLMLADALDLPSFGLLAWGGGSGYAMELAQRSPGRVRFCMTLSCPSLLIDAGRPESEGGSGRRWVQLVLRKALRWRCRLAARWVAPARRLKLLDRVAAPVDRRLLSQPGVQRWLREFLDEAARYGSRGLAQDVAGSFRLCQFDPEQLNLPVEFWYGASDRLVSDCGGRWLVARLPQGRLRRVSGAGHFFFLRHQDMVFDRLVALAEKGITSRPLALRRSPSGTPRALVA